MIRQAIRYAYPIARSRTLIGNLLRPQDYAQLLHVDKADDFLAYLHATAYIAVIAATEEKPASVTRLLSEHFFTTAARMIALLPQPAQNLCRAFLLRFEIEALKVLVRAVERPMERSHLLALVRPVPVTSTLPLDRLLKARTMAEIAEALVDTPYAPLWQEEMPQLSASRSLFPLEMRLDRWFFTQVFAASRPFAGQEHKIVQRLLGSLADVANALWSQRLRTTFRLSPDETDALLLPYGFHLSAAQRHALASWDGLEPFPFPFWHVEQTGPSLRLSLLRTLCREAQGPLLAVPFQVGVPLAYLLLGEMEVMDLTTMWEGKQWRIAASEVAHQLIRFYGPALLGAGHV